MRLVNGNKLTKYYYIWLKKQNKNVKNNSNKRNTNTTERRDSTHVKIQRYI